jgi:hypothetical protein
LMADYVPLIDRETDVGVPVPNASASDGTPK